MLLLSIADADIDADAGTDAGTDGRRLMRNDAAAAAAWPVTYKLQPLTIQHIQQHRTNAVATQIVFPLS